MVLNASLGIIIRSTFSIGQGKVPIRIFLVKKNVTAYAELNGSLVSSSRILAILERENLLTLSFFRFCGERDGDDTGVKLRQFFASLVFKRRLSRMLWKRFSVEITSCL